MGGGDFGDEFVGGDGLGRTAGRGSRVVGGCTSGFANGPSNYRGAAGARLIAVAGTARGRESASVRTKRERNMAASLLLMITEAERGVPSRIKLAVPSGGFGVQLNDMRT